MPASRRVSRAIVLDELTRAHRIVYLLYEYTYYQHTMTPPGRDLSSTMVAGQYFGELALVVESARFASVAIPPLTAL